MSRFKNSYTAKEVIVRGDINRLPSSTEPDQTLSIKQLIERHAKGINVGIREYEPYYTDLDLPNLEHMDFSELAEYRDYLSNERYRLEERLKQEKQDAKDRYAKAQAQKTDEGGTRQAPEAPQPPTTQQ